MKTKRSLHVKVAATIAVVACLAGASAELRAQRDPASTIAIMPATVLRRRQNRQLGGSFRENSSRDNSPGQGIELCYHCVRGSTEPGGAVEKERRGAGI